MACLVVGSRIGPVRFAMKFVNDFSPFIVKFGDFGIRWYGLAYVLGFVLGYLFLRKAADTNRVPNLTRANIDRLIFALIIGVMAGGRLGFCLQNPKRLFSDPLFIFKVWEGGMAFFGGLAGVVIALVWFCRREKVPFLPLGDTVTVPAALALAFGRIANFVNAELWGRPTGADWGVIYPKVDQQLRHPSELYECLSHLILAGALVLVGRRWPRRTGLMCATFVTGYGLLRVVTERFRDEPVTVPPFTSGQVAGLIVFAVGLFWFWRLRGRPAVETVDSTEPS